ncbi:MAG: Ig-like domain-containing protein [Bacteroidaceae bacterium]|nr:Ig-like domain-containing protein [Bacteroidaceae bacterium]
MKGLKIHLMGVLASAVLLSASCTETEQAPHSVPDKVQVMMAVDRFESGNATRTVVTDIDEGIIHWVDGDVIGVFPLEGYQEPFCIPADQVGQEYADYDGGYWALKEGLTYNAYYPFNEENFTPQDKKTRIPVSYLGQSQYGDAINTGAYDYTYSDWAIAPSTGKVRFQFHHIGCFAIFNVTYPATATFTRLALSTGEEALIPTAGTFDLTYSHDKTPEEGKSYVKIPFVADDDAKANELGMALYNAEGTAGISGIAGQEATFYMMLPPMDLSQAIIELVLTDSDNNECKVALAATNFEAGKKYTFDASPVLVIDVQSVSINLPDAQSTIKAGETLQLSSYTTITPANATNQHLDWISSNPKVATVSGDGMVTAVAGGTTTITATAVNGKSASCVITVQAVIDGSFDGQGTDTNNDYDFGERF